MDCIPHTDSPDKHGYGRKWLHGKPCLSHRLAWCAAHGKSLGEMHGHAKLTSTQVAEIKARYVRYCRLNGGPVLAREYGVTPMTITNIVRGLRW